MSAPSLLFKATPLKYDLQFWTFRQDVATAIQAARTIFGKIQDAASMYDSLSCLSKHRTRELKTTATPFWGGRTDYCCINAAIMTRQYLLQQTFGKEISTQACDINVWSMTQELSKSSAVGLAIDEAVTIADKN